jgi:hypothetical protein
MNIGFMYRNFGVCDISKGRGQSDLYFIRRSGSAKIKVKEPLYIEGCIDKLKILNTFRNRSDYEFFPQGYYIVENAYVLGKGLVSRNLTDIYIGDEISVKVSHIAMGAWDKALVVKNDRIILTEERSIIFKQGGYILIAFAAIHIYGHWLLDIIPRLMYIMPIIKEGNHKILLPITVPGFGIQILKYCGILDTDIEFYKGYEEIICCENLLIPTVFRYNYWCHPDIRYMYDVILSRLGCDRLNYGHKKIFISRSKLATANRKLLNSHQVEEVVGHFGFDVIWPEEYDLDFQIRTFADTSVLLGEFGSGIHNSLFAPKNCLIIVMQGNHMANFTQSTISQSKDQRTAFIFGESINRRGNGITSDYIVDINILKKLL